MGCICFFNTAIAWGGGEKWHLETSSYLHAKGHNVVVIAHKESGLLTKLRETTIPNESVAVSNLSFLNPLKYHKIRRLFKKYTIDTIVMNLPRDVKTAGYCAKKMGINRIIYRRGSAIPIKNTFLNRYYFKNVINEVLANSEATKKTVLQNNPNLFPQGNIRVIYNGIDIPPKLPKRKVKKSNGDTSMILVSLGRLEAQKNQEFLIHLAWELKNRKLPFKIIIGGDGRLKGKLTDKILELGLENEVELAGFIKEPLEFIVRGDAFLLPSLWEGFGYVLAEAALCQKPIIAFDLSSNPELVLDGKTGYLVEPENLNEFADAVEKLYKDSDLSRKMGENGFVRVQSLFDKKKKLLEIEDYLLNG